MSFRGRGGRGGGRGRGGRGGGRGGFRKPFVEEIPDTIVEVGQVLHPCQEDIVCASTNPKVSSFLLN